MTEAFQFAQFLREASAITGPPELVIEAQTKGSGGFLYEEAELASIKGATVSFAEGEERPLVEVVSPPNQPPESPGLEPEEPDWPEASPEEIADYRRAMEEFQAASDRYKQDLRDYKQHTELYERLFTAQNESDGKELIVGIVSIRSGPGMKPKIDRPITLFEVLVDLDKSSGTLRVLPASPIKLELSWLPQDLAKKFSTARPEVEDLLSVDRGQILEALSRLVNVLGPGFTTGDEESDKLAVETRFVLAYRKQTANAVTDLMNDMVEAFAEGDSPTDAYQELLDPDFKPSFNETLHEFGSLPLPSSTVQDKIVQHALSHSLTVVLGPPGTGKTHTIANTAAALIGTGKRVLVTSERELPLLEVQNKLPESMQALLLPIFSKDNVAALAKSAIGIAEHQTSAGSPQDREDEIADLEQKARKLDSEQRSLQQQLFEAAELDGSLLAVGGHDLPLKSWMAYLANDERTALVAPGGLLSGGGRLSTAEAQSFLDRFSSLALDHLKHAAYSFPTSLSEFIDAATLRPQIEYLQQTLAKLGPLEWQDLSALTEHTERIALCAENQKKLALPTVSASEILGAEQANSDLRKEAAIIHEGYYRATKAWGVLKADITGYLARYTIATLKFKDPYLSQLVEDASEFEFRPPPIKNVVEVEGDHSPIKLLSQAASLRGHLLGGGKFKGWFLTPTVVTKASELLDSVFVNDDRISSLDLLEVAIEQLEADSDRHAALNWASKHGFDLPEADIQKWVQAISNLPAEARELLTLRQSLFPDPQEWVNLGPQESLEALIKALRPYVDQSVKAIGTCSNQQIEQATARIDSAVGCLPESWQCLVRPSEEFNIANLSTALNILAEVRALNIYQPDEVSPASLKAFADKIETDSQRQHARAKLDQVLADAQAPLQELKQKSPGVQKALVALAAEDSGGYQSAWDQLVTEYKFWLAGTLYYQALAAVDGAFPAIAAAIQSADHATQQQARYVLENIADLQDFRDDYDAIMEAAESVSDADEVVQSLQKLLTKRRSVEAELAEARCWDATLSRLDANPGAITGISSMKVASKQVPKTKTAKSYPSKLAALQTALKRALPGLPGVVMNMERCAELIRFPKTDDQKFDVVIVDEASQSLFTSLFVFGLADRVIIVGDNYQTSPRIPFGAAVGLKMTQLALDLIPDHPNKNSFAADYSLFDAALSKSTPIVMTEHFRCDPQIIEISNQLSYEPNGHTLQPVKPPNPDNPSPVTLHYVEGGFIDAEGINRPEAEAIISKVLSIALDGPDGATIGVVVAGTKAAAQVRYLQQKLLSLFGPAGIAQRKLVVGTAPAFQGAERDVILVALLDAPTADTPILKRKPQEWAGQNRFFVQDLNVAVSRAKDQLHIFHSFTTQQLKEKDVRGVLLAAGKSKPWEEIDKNELKKCDSQFEEHVFAAIRKRLPKARLRTQVPAAGYKIDLVVESNGRRLAIECDGDQWHTSPESVASDMFRQGLLESLGWTFVRFLASQWYSPGSQVYWLNRIEEALNEIDK